MKKLLILSCALAFCLALAACHTTDSPDSSVPSGSPSSAIANESTAHQTEPESSLEESRTSRDTAVTSDPTESETTAPAKPANSESTTKPESEKTTESMTPPQTEPETKPAELPSEPENSCAGPRTPEWSPIRCWNTSTASAHRLQSNCRASRATLSIEADSSSAILRMIQTMSVQRRQRFGMASMWIRASTAAAVNRTTVPMLVKPLQRRAMSVRWTKLPIGWRHWSETAQSTGAISAQPSMAILPSA